MERMYKALVIGCGNIGGMYDIHSDDVITHAKAYHLRKDVELSVFDTDPEKTRALAEHYAAAIVPEIDEQALSRFDIVSICVPTDRHFGYLQQVLSANVPVVICEKPLLASLEEIAALEKTAFTSTVFVNYIRRFQPGFETVRQQLQQLLRTDRLLHVGVNYQKGFSNNGSHAIDLLEFLLDSELDFGQFQVRQAVYDFFDHDPTLSCSFVSNGTTYSFQGFSGIEYALFEIELFLANSRIRITNRGDEVTFYRCEGNQLIPEPAWSQQGMLTHYMQPVIDQALASLETPRATNFHSALRLNKKILEQLNSLQHG